MAAALVAVFLLSCQGGAQALSVSVFGPARPVSVASRQQQSCLSRKLPTAGASSSPTSVSASDTGDSSSAERAAPAGFGSRAKRRKKGGSKQRKPGGDVPPVVVLKRSSRWACVKGCGACCYLAPDERPDLAEYLSDPKEFELYLSMSADDGWCKHFDKEERACTIYEDRPRFCRVETETFGDMYGVDPEDMDDFCSACCSEQIGDVYGGKSKEMRVFKAALAALERGDRPNPELKPFGVDFQGEEKQIRDWGLGETSVDDARER